MPKTEPSLEKLSRREFLQRGSRLGFGALGTILLPYNIFAQRKISYIEATKGDSKTKQDYLDQIIAGDKLDYIVSVEYATPKTLQELAEKYNYRPEPDEKALVLPISGELGNGIKSKIYVFDRLFTNPYGRFLESQEEMEFIIRNGLLNKSFVYAKYLNQGIPNYPVSLFVDSGGNVNRSQYKSLANLLSLSSEYIGVLSNPKARHSKFLTMYSAAVRKTAIDAYGEILNPTMTRNMDKNFIERLKKDFHPAKLFPEQVFGL